MQGKVTLNSEQRAFLLKVKSMGIVNHTNTKFNLHRIVDRILCFNYYYKNGVQEQEKLVAIKQWYIDKMKNGYVDSDNEYILSKK